ncbi:MAG: amidohydrolase/deacetylase family metallohydrolase [Candidatus Latescibacteria bacterium]|nr:amidohydrolase/deacetylase family metallohydrolase [Candidatus Latescibacterota bacterium]
MLYDLLIKGGTLIDPAQNVHARQDVAFSHGKVAAVGSNLDPAQARQTLDANGRLVTPGLIDLHVHVYWGVSHLGVDPDSTCLARGATTVVDAGSAGADTFPGFRKFIIDVSDTRILAQLNISSQGMLTSDIGEFELPEYANVDKACRMIEQHRDLILGIKVRLTRESIVSQRSGMIPLHRAREAADAVGLPIMVHPQAAWCDTIDDVLAVMKKGDILTHCFHGMDCGIFDDHDQIRPSVHDALERGVLFDVGHGAGSFSWDVAERALAAGVVPQTISSDLHTGNINGPVYDLVNIISKFLELDMDLDAVLAKVTSVPAQVIGMEDQIGTLAVGAWGDAVVLDQRQGQFQLADSSGQIRTGKQFLEPMAVIKGGRVYRQY